MKYGKRTEGYFLSSLMSVCTVHKRKTGQDRTGHSNTQHIDYMSVPNVGWDGKGGERV